MQLKNTTQVYGWVSIGIHWLMAVSLLGLFALGAYMVELTYLDAWYHPAPHWHKSVGMLMLLLLLFRLVWRISNPLPHILGSGFEKIIALLVHRMHYVFMLTVMLSGYLIVTADGRGIEIFNWFEIPAIFAAEKGREELAGLVHMLSAWGFMAFIVLHAGAALKHHFIDSDNTLIRMLGIKKENNNE
ncbi:MAG: cytochrome b [Ghiorsea sp.]